MSKLEKNEINYEVQYQMNPMLKIKLKKNKNKSLKNFENESEFFLLDFTVYCYHVKCQIMLANVNLKGKLQNYAQDYKI